MEPLPFVTFSLRSDRSRKQLQTIYWTNNRTKETSVLSRWKEFVVFTRMSKHDICVYFNGLQCMRRKEALMITLITNIQQISIYAKSDRMFWDIHESKNSQRNDHTNKIFKITFLCYLGLLRRREMITASFLHDIILTHLTIQQIAISIKTFRKN